MLVGLGDMPVFDVEDVSGMFGRDVARASRLPPSTLSIRRWRLPAYRVAARAIFTERLTFVLVRIGWELTSVLER